MERVRGKTSPSRKEEGWCCNKKGPLSDDSGLSTSNRQLISILKSTLKAPAKAKIQKLMSLP